MSLEELDVIKCYLDSYLAKGFIKTSSALYSSSVLFIKKSDGRIQFYIDYRRLNVIIKKNCYLIFVIEKTLA